MASIDGTMASRPRTASRPASVGRVERTAEAARPAVGERPAPAQDLLADRQPDDRLGLVRQERQVPIEQSPRDVGVAGLVRQPDRPEHFGEGEPGHRPAGAPFELPQRRRAAEPAEDGEARVGGQEAADLRRRRRVLELDGPGAGRGQARLRGC